MAGPFGNIGSVTSNLGKMGLDKGAAYVGSKARGAVTSFLNTSKSAFFSEAPAFQQGAGYLSDAAKKWGSGTGAFGLNSLKPIFLQQTAQLNTVAKNTAATVGAISASDRNQERRAKEAKKHAEEQTKKITDAVEESGGGGGVGGAIGNLISDRLKFALAAIGTIGAGAMAASLGARAFGGREVRGRSTRAASSLRERQNILAIRASSQARTGASSSGSSIQTELGPIAVKDEALKEGIEKGFEQQRKTLKDISANTKISLGNEQARQRYQRRVRQTKPVDTRTAEEKLQDKIEERFTRRFQTATTTAYNKAITDALEKAFPGLKKGVTKSQASGEMYIGQQLSKATGLEKGTQRLFEKALGKEYGSIFAPVFSELATGYAQLGGQMLGKAMFSSVLGEQDAQVLTGQIIGNFQKGNKATAYEQLLYGLTGVAAGPETIFRKYGFADTTSGITYMAGELGARTTEMMQGITGFGTPGQVTRPVPPQQMRQMMDTTGYNVQSTQGIEDIKRQEESIKNQIAMQDAMDAGYENQLSATEDAAKLNAQGQQAGIAAQQYGTQQVVSALDRQTAAMAGMGRGGGTNIGIGFGGAGGGMSPFGNMMLDLGASMATASLTKGIKDPGLRAVANIVGQLGFTSIGKSIFTGGSVTSGLSSTFGFDLSGLFGSSGGVGGTGGGFTGGNYGSVGSSAGGTNHLANLPYYYAAYQALTGDLRGGAITAGSYYAGTALAATTMGTAATAGLTAGLTSAGLAAGTAATIGSAVVTGGLSLVVGAVLGGLFGKKKRRPPPQIISRALQIEGNNNPNSKVTIYSTGNPSQSLSDIADGLLNVAFNTIKMFEQDGYQLGKNERIQYIEMHMNNYSNTRLRIHTQPYSKYKEGDYYYEYGKPENTTGANVGQTASRIVKDITNLYKEKNASAGQKADEIAKTLNRKSIFQLAEGTIVELRKMDQSVTSGVIAENLALQDALSKSILAEQQKSSFSWNNRVGSRNYQGSIVKETEIVDSGDSQYERDTGNYLIWQDGKYVRLTQDLADKYGFSMTTTPDTRNYDWDGQLISGSAATTTVDTSKVVGVTPTGIPILDVDNSGGITAADYEALISKFGYEATTGSAPVNNNNVSDNSTTVNNFGLFDTNDPLRSTSVSTRMPLAA